MARGINPIDARQEAERAARLEALPTKTFRTLALEYIAAHEGGWRNAKHRAQWRSSLKTYAFPVLGDMEPAAIETAHVLQVLQPIWLAKVETASRVRGRIETVLAAATVIGIARMMRPRTRNALQWEQEATATALQEIKRWRAIIGKHAPELLPEADARLCDFNRRATDEAAALRLQRRLQCCFNG